MKINWKVRMINPLWWAQIILAILTPLFAYFGLTAQQITSWSILGDVLLKALGNPYILCLIAVSVYNAINDPTTRGASDSARAMSYTTLSGLETEYEDIEQ